MTDAFTIKTIHSCVAVVKMHTTPTMAVWEQYETCYKRLYDKYAHFIIVFDLSDMSIPPLDIIEAKRNLIVSLKPRSIRQLFATFVYTPSDTIRSVITAIITAAGQSAPFYAHSNVSALAAQVADHVRILRRLKAPPSSGRKMATWGDIGSLSVSALVVLYFCKCIRVLLRTKRWKNGRSF